MTGSAPPLRLRHSPALAVAAVIMILAGVSIGTWAPYLLPLLIIPGLIAVWAWRAGTDVDADAVTVRALIGRRRVPWSEITGFVTDDRGHVVARLDSGSALQLAGVRAADIPRLLAMSGHGLVTDHLPER